MSIQLLLTVIFGLTIGSLLTWSALKTDKDIKKYIEEK